MSICTVRTGNRGSRQEYWESYARIAQLNFEVNGGTSTMERSDRQDWRVVEVSYFRNDEARVNEDAESEYSMVGLLGNGMRSAGYRSCDHR